MNKQVRFYFIKGLSIIVMALVFKSYAVATEFHDCTCNNNSRDSLVITMIQKQIESQQKAEIQVMIEESIRYHMNEYQKSLSSYQNIQEEIIDFFAIWISVLTILVGLVSVLIPIISNNRRDKEFERKMQYFDNQINDFKNDNIRLNKNIDDINAIVLQIISDMRN